MVEDSARRTFLREDAVEIGVSVVGFVVIDIDRNRGGNIVPDESHAWDADAFDVTIIEDDNGIGPIRVVDRADDTFRSLHEFEVGGNGIFVKHGYLFAEKMQGSSHGNSGTEGISIRAEVGDDGKILPVVDQVPELFQEGWRNRLGLHKSANGGKCRQKNRVRTVPNAA